MGPEAIIEVRADTHEQILSRTKDEPLSIVGVDQTDAYVASQPGFP
jgi:hypothetical protein